MNHYSWMKKILFKFPPETAANITLKSLQIAYRFHLTQFFFKNFYAPREVMGLIFPNPIGLAAGVDKSGDYIAALASLGFGFIELGGVTPIPQPGHPKPRIFRIEKEEAIINHMGFNNKGADYLAERLKNFRSQQATRNTPIIGANIGKNMQTPLEHAADDYVYSFRVLAPYVDYIAVNISSPNTTNLRQLQHQEYLPELLKILKHEQANQKKYIPLVIKISPDLSQVECEKMAAIFLQQKIDGVIATNTKMVEQGGLSGRPLSVTATEIIKIFHERLQNKIPLIASGGVMDKKSAAEKFSAGASLIQVYTGLVYRGWQLIEELKEV